MNKVRKNTTIDNDVSLSIVSGDITEETCDAIVNAANSYLMHGGGVAGAIVKKGGRVIQDESNTLSPVSVGSAVYTSAGSLPAEYVIHTVGPRWREGDDINKLKNAIRSALECADKLEVKSLSIPAVSTGIFRFPVDLAAGIIITELKNYFESKRYIHLKEVRICLYDENVLNVFLREWDATFSLAESM